LVESFRALVEQRTGLSFVAGKTDDLAELLRQRAAASGMEPAVYLARFEHGDARAELRDLAPLLTVAETFFFRHASQIDAFRALAQQHMTQPASAGRPLRVLSAGCASGEEAYTLAIVLRELQAGAQPNAVIMGVDLNPKVIERARRARYSEWSLRSVGDDVRTRWFRRSGGEQQLDPSIHAAVSFVEGNLVQPDRELLGPGRWDVIFCRNVLMYFSPDKARLALANLTRALSDAGHLFMGHAETLRGLSQDYHLCHTHDAFYYQRKTSPASIRPPAALLARANSVEPSPVEAAPCALEQRDPPNWFADIDRATARVRGLGATKASEPANAAAPAGQDWAPVLELMQSDRHSEALALFGVTAATEENADADQLLVEATLLTHANRFPAAEAVCNRLLLIDELNAGAHYVLALCREAAADVERALYHDQVAAYLDPAFAMPHVHMGLLLRRTGRREAARLELTQAHALLEREDTARLAMFGGGFGRSALRALCLAEPSGSGGSA
jgi:chemotaxis protein methyltransferase CheR